MKFCGAFLLVILSAVCVNPSESHRQSGIHLLGQAQETKLTYTQRLTNLEKCLEREALPEGAIKKLTELFEKLEGRTDGFYVLRAKEILGNAFPRGRRCVCQEIYSSAHRGTATHSLSVNDEYDIINESCIARRVDSPR